MKKQLLLIVIMLLPMVARAFTGMVEIGGINYYIVTKGQIAEVISKNSGYSGEIIIPETIEYEGVTCQVTAIRNAFMGCNDLTTVSIPQSVTSIGERAFYGCSNLKSVNIPGGVTVIKYETFANCPSLTSIIIPENVTRIEDGAFFGCTGFNTIFIPNSVETIGSSAFAHCSSLLTITIGNGCKNIEYAAFEDCPEMTDFYCYATTPPEGNNNFFNGSYVQYATLHVPGSSISSYKSTGFWAYFKNVVPIEQDDLPKCEKPIISYEKGQLKFTSATEGVEFVSEVTNADVKKNYVATVTLTATYNINVYATKSGYNNSNVTTATLCWIDAEPVTEGITNGIAQIPAKAVLIQSEGSIVKVEGIDDGTTVTIYTPDGKQAGSSVCRNGAALVGTNIQPGNVAIVRIGEKSIKVVVK